LMSVVEKSRKHLLDLSYSAFDQGRPRNIQGNGRRMAR
jgi:hypothetical protein